MKSAQIIGLLICLTAISVATVASAATYGTYALATAYAEAISPTPGQKVTFGQSESDDGIDDYASANAAAVAVGYLSASGSGTSYSLADFGDIWLSVDATATGTGVAGDLTDSQSLGGGSATIEAQAGWRDRITLNIPLLPPGHSIKLFANFHLVGKVMRADATLQPPLLDKHPTYPEIGATAAVDFHLTVTDTLGHVDPLEGCYLGSLCGFREVRPAENVDVTSPIPDYIKTAFTVPNGFAANIGFDGRLSATVGASQTTVAEALGLIIDGSIRWGGIDRVEDAETGEVYEDWSIASDSGFDYSQPFVPEPSSLVLLAAAAIEQLAIGLRRRQ